MCFFVELLLEKPRLVVNSNIRYRQEEILCIHTSTINRKRHLAGEKLDLEPKHIGAHGRF